MLYHNIFFKIYINIIYPPPFSVHIYVCKTCLKLLTHFFKKLQKLIPFKLIGMAWPQSWLKTNFWPGFKSWPGLKFGLLNNAWHHTNFLSQTDIINFL